jgi:hypothetical protein
VPRDASTSVKINALSMERQPSLSTPPAGVQKKLKPESSNNNQA